MPTSEATLMIVPPPCRRMCGSAGLGAVDLPQEVDLDDPVDLLDGHVLELGVDADRGVVDPGVDPAERLDSPVGQAFDVIPDGHIGDDDLGLAPGPPDLLGHFLERVSFRAPRVTAAPWRANSMAANLPIPDEAPVMTTDCSLRGRVMMCLPSGTWRRGGPCAREDGPRRAS